MTSTDTVVAIENERLKFINQYAKDNGEAFAEKLTTACHAMCEGILLAWAEEQPNGGAEVVAAFRQAKRHVGFTY